MSGLTPKEIVQAQARIDAMPAGIYEVNGIYGTRWLSIDDPTDFGTRFKITVLAGELKHIKWNGRKSNNHQDYEIFK